MPSAWTFRVAADSRGVPSVCHVERSVAQSRHLAPQTAHHSISTRSLDYARDDRKAPLPRNAGAHLFTGMVGTVGTRRRGPGVRL
jgi:hypothetical protein